MKMKIKKSGKKKITVNSLLLGIVLVFGGLVYMLYAQSPSKNSYEKTSDSPSSEQGRSQYDDKDTPNSILPQKSETNGTASNNDEINADRPTQKVEQPRIERAQQSGNNIKIVASLQKASRGSCEVRLQKAGGTLVVKRTTKVVVGPTYYACSFSIPLSEVPSSGSWNITVSHVIGEAISVAPVQAITVSRP